MTHTNTVPILPIRKRLGRDDWQVPEEFGPAGWTVDHRTEPMRIIITDAPMSMDDGAWWRHASIARQDRTPSYDEIQMMHRAVWPDGWAYQLFGPPSAHVNIHEFALHLWGKPDGRIVLPNFGGNGRI